MPNEEAASLSISNADLIREDVYHIAMSVRDTLQKLSDNRLPLIIRIENSIHRVNPKAPVTFPRNWCDYSSCVLALQLARYLDDPAINLCKSHEDGVHWWLRYADFDIDITADQYEHTNEPVIVERESQTHELHFHDPSPSPFFSRERCSSPYFERLVDRLDAEVDQHLKPDRGIHAMTWCMGDRANDEE
tara:strand:+ start:19398 stop:19967 length:570 start_codon:yes stop_codon:yes gene_type:complete